MFDKFKNLARLLSFVFIFNFLVLNFGIKPKEVKASTDNINSLRVLNFDYSRHNKYMHFDFANSLVEGERITAVELKEKKDGAKSFVGEAVSGSDTKFILKNAFIDDREYIGKVTIQGEGNKTYNMSFNVNFQAPETQLKPTITIENSKNLKINLNTFKNNLGNSIGMKDGENVTVSVIKENWATIHENLSTVKTAQQVNETNGIILLNNALTHLTVNTPYLLRVNTRYRDYIVRFFVTGTASSKKINHMRVLVQDSVRNDDGTINLNIKFEGVSPTKADQVKIKDASGSFKTGTLENSVFKFKNLDVRTDTKYVVRFEKDSNNISECYYTNSGYGAFIPFKGSFSSETPDVVNFNIADMFPFFAKDNTKNKFSVYELNDDGVTNKKELGSKTGVGIAGKQTLALNGNLESGKIYKVEFNNGTKSYYRTVRYEAFDVSSSDVKHTSAVVHWNYPKNYTPQSGDRVEIFLKERRIATYPATPKELIVHGSGGINLASVRSKKIVGITPGTNYDAKIVLYNQRGAITSITNFITKAFELTKPIEVKDAAYSSDIYKVAFIRSRTMTVQWDFSSNDIEFNPGDKLEIFVKPNGNTNFSGYPINDPKYGNPVFSSTQKLNTIKSAEIVVPSWMTKFHVDLIYTVGGNRVIFPSKDGYGEAGLNRRTVEAKVNKPKLSVTDITQTSAKVKWEYDRDNAAKQTYQPENGHIVKLHIKKINSMNDNTTGGFSGEENDAVFYYEHGKNGLNVLDKKEFEITGLEVGQCYRLRLQHILQKPGDFDNNYRTVEEFYNFQTGAFTIENLKAEQISQSPKVKLTWGTSSTPMFGEGESEQNNIKVYLKEGNTSEYPTEPLKGVTISNYIENGREGSVVQLTKQCEIELPKYNTQYNVKLEYTLNGKKIEQITMARADGNIMVSIEDVNNTKATIKWEYPNGYESLKSSRENDKIVVKVNENFDGKVREGNNLGDFSNGKEIIVTSDSNGKIEVNSLTGEKDYDVEVKFINSGKEVYRVNTEFKATSQFQIVALVAKDITTNSASLSWNYVGTHSFVDNQDKLDIFIKDVTKDKQRAGSDDIRTDYKKIISYTHKDDAQVGVVYDGAIMANSGENHSRLQERQGNLKTVKSVELSELLMGKEYSIKLQYMKGSSSSEANGNPREVIFETMNPKFDATVFTSNQTTATFGWEYPKGYTLIKGDKVEIFIKQMTDDNQEITEGKQPDGLGYENALLTLSHGTDDLENGTYNLYDVTRVDVSGLTPEKKYKAKVKFTMNGGTSPSIETEVNISTKSFSIKSFEVDSYEEYDILVKWEIEPENMMFNEADKLEIFVKLKDGNYPQEPSYVLTTTPTQDGKTISNTFSDYVLAESIGVEQNMKLVYTVGDKTYEKELTFTNAIDPLKAKVFSVNETRALIEVETPSNYEFVNGDALLIYAKDEFSDGNVQSDDFLVFEGVQSDTLSIADDMKLIELSYLLPEAKYDIVVALDLEDGTVEPVKLEFTTEALPITDIKLESINFDGSTISWDYGDNEIDFYKDEQNDNFTDKLLVGVKESDGTPIPDDFNAIKQIAVEEHSGKDIANVKDAKITVEDKTKDYEVAICCDIGGLSYIKKTKLSFLSVSVDETSVLSDTAKVIWKYPSNITFGDSDKTEVFLRKKDDSNYPESPAFSSTGSGTTSYDLTGLEGSTEYIVKVQITKEGLTIDPVEAEFTTKGAASSEVVVDQPEYEITGTAAEIAIPNAEELDIDLEQPIGLVMGDEAFTGFSIKFNESGTAFTIEPTIPKKKYENIEVEIPLKDGTTFKMSIKEFTTQPADTAQDWLSNAYWFAFERFPDEEGYNYWYAHRILPKTLNGEYFLKNLLFAEDEFTNRNLQDKELIAALYQIVVNREYDEEGLNFWVGIYNENLQNAQGDKKLAQEVLVDRMAHEPEFGKLCERVGIFWRQSDQDAAGVPS